MTTDIAPAQTPTVSPATLPTQSAPVRCVSYNIQFGVGLDGVYDIGRIARTVEQADIIALQEVTRHCPWNGAADMVAELEAALPGYFTAFHAAADMDMGSALEGGRAVSRRFQFGNMVLSRFPILTVRGHLLPRSLRPGGINLQRGALEVVIAAPGGPLRLYCVHLDHVDADERVAQIAALKDIAFAMPVRGGAVSDVTALGFAEPPLPDGFMVAGDFNLEPSSREQTALLRDGGMLIDCSAGDEGWSWTDPKDRAITQRLDYVVATPDLAARIVDVTIDREADGSDHMPLWFTLV